MLGMVLFNYPILALFNVPARCRRAGSTCTSLAWAALIRAMARRSPSPGVSTGFPAAERTMLHGTTIILISFAYLGLLFAIAYFAGGVQVRAVQSRARMHNLSPRSTRPRDLYGVGRAARDGVGFLPIYIGPTLMIALWWVVLRRSCASRRRTGSRRSPTSSSALRQERAAGGLVTVIGHRHSPHSLRKAVSASDPRPLSRDHHAGGRRESFREDAAVDGVDTGRSPSRRHPPSRRR